MPSEGLWKTKIIKFLSAQTISLLGSSLVQYAIIWYITLKTSSGTMMAVATLCGYLPQICLSLFAGFWIDRYNRRLLIIASDAVIALSTFLIAVLFLFGYQQIWLLFAVLILRSMGTGVQVPTVNAIIPQLVPPEKLLKVNSINSTINAVMMFISPVLSGIILSIAGIEMTFFIDVITAVIGIGIMFGINIPDYEHTISENDIGPSVFNEIRQGIKYLAECKNILRLMIFIAVTMVLISPTAFLTPLLVARSFGAEIWRLSVSEMCFSLGAAVGGLILALRCQSCRHIRMITGASAIYGLLMVLLGLSPWFVLYLLFNFLIGVSMPCFNAPLTSLLQKEVVPGLHGRVFSILQIVNACALPLGTVVFGPLADIVNVGVIMAVNGLIVIIWSWYNRNIIFYKNEPSK